MKRFILSLCFVLATTIGFAQAPFMYRNYEGQFAKYEIVDSLTLENVLVHFDKEIDNEDFIDMGAGDYIAPAPHKDKIVIRTNADRTKAIVVYNSYVFGRHFEFNVQDNERRTILWYQDKNIYCGYVYDKQYKVATYYESKKQYKRLMRWPMFNRRI